MKSHIGPDGPSRCKAEKGNCPFEDPSAEGTNHFDTIKEAREEYERRLKESYSEVTTIKSQKFKLTEKEKQLRESNAEMAKRLVEARSESSDGIIFEDANPARAKRRLDEAIEFATSRHNDHLVQKLSKSSVLPSGAFKTADGKRVNTDKILQKKLLVKHIESEREAALKALAKSIQDENPTKNKFSLKTDRASYSMTVSEDLDKDAFEELPQSLKDKCSTQTKSLNIDLAREHISPAKLREITTESQTLDFIYGKEPDVGQGKYKVSTNFKGDTADEKLESGLKNIAEFYDNTTKEEGRVRELKAYVADGSDAIKSATAGKKQNTFIPARSQYNGGLVSGRVSISKAKAEALLTQEELDSISVTSSKPDPVKARQILPDETFGKIFKAKKVSLRVTEKKD